MSDFYNAFVTPLFAFFAVMNPLANAPVFLGLTETSLPSQRRTIAIRGVLVAVLVVAVFTLAGAAVLKLFGITIAAVRAFGGLIVARIGLELIANPTPASHQPVDTKTSAGLGIAISPLAIPILAGPGTLATALGLTAGTGWLEKGAVLLSFATVALLNLTGFLVAETLVKRLGEDLIGATSKVMGIILGAIGTQMVIAGVVTLVKS